MYVMRASKMRVVEGAYVQLEDAYCLRSVEEAMRIAEPIEVYLQAMRRPRQIRKTKPTAR